MESINRINQETAARVDHDDVIEGFWAIYSPDPFPFPRGSSEYQIIANSIDDPSKVRAVQWLRSLDWAPRNRPADGVLFPVWEGNFLQSRLVHETLRFFAGGWGQVILTTSSTFRVHRIGAPPQRPPEVPMEDRERWALYLNPNKFGATSPIVYPIATLEDIQVCPTCISECMSPDDNSMQCCVCGPQRTYCDACRKRV